ncbi:hypothetical protein [Alkanindiges illinoisensis]|uniref:Uncharacterized protein n=1 Tax=Alkanindiges illinoisensis TaxID=197183 RepID=A0A4Y7X8M9_9GAMM|nr:hypothetical protein [Alkanindiges illinoisensis]TEU23378.1 hypothetical protein E2B99_13770 [Alkanindiges illinoisensis]
MSAQLRKELAQALNKDQYDMTGQGLYFPRQGIMAMGQYFDRINGGEWQETPNLVVTEGLAHILNVALGSKVKSSGYYLALFSGATAPAANWTAANFASVASEVISLTEGYSGATRPQWNPVDTATNSIDNMTATASVTIATSSTLNVTGAALLTNSTRGGTTGTLISATKYAAARTFQNGDVYDIGYRLSLTV